MNWRDVKVLYWRELRSALRERNIVVNSILLPIFLYPILLWLVYLGFSFVMGQTEGFSSRIMLANLPPEHQQLKTELSVDKQVELRTLENPMEALRKGALDLLIEFLPPDEGGSNMAGNFRARVYYDKSKERSDSARTRVNERLGRYRDRVLERGAGKIGVSPAQLQSLWIESHNLSTSRQMGQFILGLMLPLFLVIMLSVGCMHPAIDSTAGEREKSTWETLMTTATARGNIAVAKYMYVSTMACAAGFLNLAAMLFSIKAVLSPILGDSGAGFTFRIPLSSIPLIVLLTFLLALFVAAGMMILASFARTFKEGQSMVTPFYMAVFLPILFLQSPGMELTLPLALIPVINVAMVFREAIAGVYRWPLIGVTIAVETGCILIALWLAALILRYEDFIIGSYSGSFGRFVKQRLLAGRGRGGNK